MKQLEQLKVNVINAELDLIDLNKNFTFETKFNIIEEINQTSNVGNIIDFYQDKLQSKLGAYDVVLSKILDINSNN